MPLQEIVAIVRPLERAGVKLIVKECAKILWDHQAVISRLLHLGHRELPFSLKTTDGTKYWTGSYWLFQAYVSEEKFMEVRETLNLHPGLLRARLNRLDKVPVEPNDPYRYTECTIEEEELPAALRPDVKRLIASGKTPDPKWQI